MSHPARTLGGVRPVTSGRRRYSGAGEYADRRFAGTGERNAAKYGLTEAAFWDLVRGQGFACPICGARFDPNGPKMVIDHNHATDDVRGVLCSRCNWALGAFGDSPSLLRAALRYLTERGCYGADDPEE